jgi:multidrug efflux system outer membrane protein
MKTHLPVFRTLAPAALIALVSGCMVGPNYKAPTAAAPVAFRWSAADSKSGVLDARWWETYHDPILDGLITRALENNNDLHAALARVDESRALARLTRADLLPELNGIGGFSKYHLSTTTGNVFPDRDYNDALVGLDLSYEIDFWGRVRRSAAATRAQAEGSADDYEAMRLGISTEVAIGYFSLRSLDTEIDVLYRAISLREESVELTGARSRTQVTSAIDFSRAKAELASARAQLDEVLRQRSRSEHALAILCGEQASTFRVAAQAALPEPPSIPQTLPSQLVGHRPDLAAAERQLAAASEQIGVAMAGFLPTVRLNATGGYEAEDTGDLFKWGSRLLDAGPSVSLPIFTAGRTRAQVESSKARLEEARSAWEQKVLVAFGEVEDALRDQQLLGDLAVHHEETVAAAHDVSELSSARYRNGLVNYLDVVDAQRTELEAQRQLAQTTGQRFIASIELVKALGGGWEPAAEIVALQSSER